MTLRRGGPVPPASYPQNHVIDGGFSTGGDVEAPTPADVDERRQREHELTDALTAARALQARLELLGDRAADVAVVRSLRDSLARNLGLLSPLRTKLADPARPDARTSVHRVIGRSSPSGEP